MPADRSLPETHSADARAGAWSRYWASGARHSCVGSFADDYAGAIRDFWRPHLTALGAGERMLDIGTGNGPLVKLAVDLAAPEFKPARIDAVDLATPAPDWLHTLPARVARQLHFHAGVAAESLPFEDASFDLVTSQFGIEYAGLERAFAEVFRVLTSSGRAALVCHHRDSVLNSVAAAESGHLQWLTGASGIFPATEALLPAMARLSTAAGVAAVSADPGAARQREHFNQRMQALSVRASSHGVPDCLHEAAGAMIALLGAARSEGLDATLRQLAELRGALEDARLRSAELCTHALGDEAIEELSRQAAGGGWSLTAQPLHDEGRLLGWGIEIERAD